MDLQSSYHDKFITMDEAVSQINGLLGVKLLECLLEIVEREVLIVERALNRRDEASRTVVLQQIVLVVANDVGSALDRFRLEALEVLEHLIGRDDHNLGMRLFQAVHVATLISRHIPGSAAYKSFPAFCISPSSAEAADHHNGKKQKRNKCEDSVAFHIDYNSIDSFIYKNNIKNTQLQ